MIKKVEVELRDELSGESEVVVMLPRRDHCEIQALRFGPSGQPAVVMERCGDLQARIYDASREEPIVSVIFDAEGNAKQVIVRRAPDLTPEFEDIPALTKEEE